MNEQLITPWYKQFWPWFLIALPGTVVVASLYTVYIAFTNQDSMVESDYYKQGLAINQTFANIERADELEIQAALIFSDNKLILEVANLPEETNDIQFSLYHPFDKSKDIALTFTEEISSASSAQRVFQVEFPEIEYGRYHLELFVEGDNGWKIKKETVYPLDKLSIGTRRDRG